MNQMNVTLLRFIIAIMITNKPHCILILSVV